LTIEDGRREFIINAKTILSNGIRAMKPHESVPVTIEDLLK